MQIRPYKPGDEQQIQEFDWLLFPDPYNKRNLKNWFWRYKGNNPAGDSIIYLMEHEGKIISHFAVIPYRIRFFGEDTLASHSIGAMVAPEYQGKGIIKFVADKMFEEVVKRGIKFSWGFPNNLAYDLHKRIMGYEDIAQVYCMQRQTGPFNTDEKLAQKLSFKPVQKFDKSVDALWDKEKDSYKISIVRDHLYLNWRFLERPDQKYHAFAAYDNDQLVGYVILKLYKDEKVLKGHIVDIFSPVERRDTAKFLIEKCQGFFLENKTDIENAWVMGSKLYNSILEEKGFKSENPRPLICRLNMDKEKYRPAIDQSNWYFTMGDTTEIY